MGSMLDADLDLDIERDPFGFGSRPGPVGPDGRGPLNGPVPSRAELRAAEDAPDPGSLLGREKG